MFKQNKIMSVLALSGVLAMSTLTACGGGTDVIVGPAKPAEPVAPPKPVASVITVDFNAGIDGWSADVADFTACLLYTSPSPRDATLSRMPSSA